jgi:hypothetical protein
MTIPFALFFLSTSNGLGFVLKALPAIVKPSVTKGLD